MLRLNRYIGRTVMMAILMVLLVMVGIDLLTALIDEAQNLSGHYDFGAALIYVLMTAPTRFHEYLPFAALVGCLTGLGTLANNSELVVMRAAGVSVARLVWAVLRPTLLLTFFGLVIGEWVSPRVQQIAESYRAVALQTDLGGHSKFGMWHREGNRFMHFNAVEPNGVLYGVSVYDLDDKLQLKRSLYAQRAIYQSGKWVLEAVKESFLYEAEAVQKEFSSKVWKTELTPELLTVLVLKPSDLSISASFRYAQYLHAQGINDRQYRLAFWNKLLQPLTIISLVLVGISFVFGPLRNVTVGYRIFIGVLIGVTFQTLQNMLAPMSLVYGFAPILASLVPILISIAAGLYMLSRRV